MSEQENILVTGGNGFIGSHLVADLIDSCQFGEVVVADNMSMATRANLEPYADNPDLTIHTVDVANHDDMADIMTQHSIGAVCHLATGTLVDSLGNPGGVAENIIGMQMSLLELLRFGKFTRLISFSTSEVYGSSDDRILDEESLLKPQTTYAAAKASADLMALAYRQSFKDEIGGRTTVIRPFNNFGPGKKVRNGGGIIPQTIVALNEGRSVPLTGGGTARREFVYVKDTVAAVRAVLAEPEITGDQLYVVSSGEPRSMRSIVDDIAGLMGVEADIEDLPPRPGDVSHLHGNGSKIKRELGFETTTPWLEGLKRCIDFYTEHPELVGQ